MRAGGQILPLITLDAVVVGSGCAGFNAADWLYDLGRTDIAVLTEGVDMGTSRNTGSDKQTYYKLSLASDGEDSVAKMAEDLFAGGGVNGDTALAEAACSVRSFIKLANLGVPFPTNAYGEYVGYKTDHDPRQRATSAGPLTSRYMTECLERSVRRKGIPILDGLCAVRLLVSEEGVEGLLCLDRNACGGPARGLTVVRAKRVVMATGGPAGCYFASVYPESQTGMTGMMLEAGAAACNLQEWQYGLASTSFRWNVSGTYQQVLPRYISIDREGIEREFLPGYFTSPHEALDRVFLKGYQWPFDTGKIGGSSLIDILVHHETADLGRRVYLDFRSDPAGLERGLEGLGEEAYRYLAHSGALLPTPIARLEKMNPLAIDLYKRHGIDLYAEPLEIGVCAQHHNGGIAVDADWQSGVRGLYVAGEAAGTFGVRRPGGSALNAAQVGSLRAAEHIADTTRPDTAPTPAFVSLAEREAEEMLALFDRALRQRGASSVQEWREEKQRAMSLYAGHIRDEKGMAELEGRLSESLARFPEGIALSGPGDLYDLLKSRDIALTQLAVLSAMRAAAARTGTRGSALVTEEGGERVHPALPGYAYRPNRPLGENTALVTERADGTFRSAFQPVRPLPHPDGWFETVWEEYRRRTGGRGEVRDG